MSSDQLILLGTGTPNCEPERVQQSAALIINDRPYLIDCGGGTVQRLSQAQIRFDRLTRLFLTHLHPDHTVGLADLMIHSWVKERKESMQIYGAVGTAAMVDHLQQAYQIGIAEHIQSTPMGNDINVIVHEYDEGVIYTDEQVVVTALRVQHMQMDAFALKFETADGKTIVHSGDTRPVPAMAQFAKGCDILIHEVYFTAGLATRSPAWQHYHTHAHTSGQELLSIVNEARPKLLVLNHQLVWGEYTEQDLIDEMTDGYAGEVVYGRDLMVVDL